MNPSLKFFLSFFVVVLATGCAVSPRVQSNMNMTSASYAVPFVVPSRISEDEYWKVVDRSNNPKDIQRYLVRFPNGKHTNLAKLRLKVLARSTSVTN